MARVRDKAPLLAIAFSDGTDYAAGKEPYQHEDGGHARRGDARAVDHHAAESRQHAPAVQEGQQDAVIHGIAGKAVILHKAAFLPAGKRVRRILGHPVLIHGKIRSL